MSKELTYTMIEEAARAKLGISRDEYALCNYIQTWASHPAARISGYCDRTRAQMAEFIGIGERGIQKMLPRMVALGLIERSKTGFNYRITAQWFDAVMLAERARKGEQSSPKGRTKFTPDHEQSSPLTTNKVHPHTKYNTELHTEIENARENSADVEAEKKSIPPIPAAPPSWFGRPNTDTPDKMRADLQSFYEQYPADWQNLLNNAGVKYTAEQRREIVTAFCSYQIENNRTANTYKQTHAALQRWFIGQKAMRQPAPSKSTITQAGRDVEHYRKPQAF